MIPAEAQVFPGNTTGGGTAWRRHIKGSSRSVCTGKTGPESGKAVEVPGNSVNSRHRLLPGILLAAKPK